MKKNSLNNRGFTLIEVMVAISIFAIVTSIGTASLLSMVDGYKKSRVQRIAIDNINFIIDTMGRDIRTGSRYSPSDDPERDPGAFVTDPAGNMWSNAVSGVPSSIFSFKNQDGCDVTYKLQDEQIMRRKDNGVCEGGDFEQLTNSSYTTITNLEFYVTGASRGAGDTIQPLVTIVIQGEARKGTETAPLTMQTSITQRFLDFPL